MVDTGRSISNTLQYIINKNKKNFLKSIQSLKIIDMCCAPGGKTAQLLDNDLVIDCIEKIRIDPEFLKKYGST